MASTGIDAIAPGVGRTHRVAFPGDTTRCWRPCCGARVKPVCAGAGVGAMYLRLVRVSSTASWQAGNEN